MALLQDMFSLYTDNTTGALIGVLVATVAVYFIFFAKPKQPVVLKETKSREIKSMGTKTAEKKADVKAPQKEATIEPVTKQASEADKESEASVNVTVKKEPVLAAYDATAAIYLLECRQYIESHFKVSSKRSISDDALVCNAAVAIASGAAAVAITATAVGQAIKSERTKAEELEFSNDSNELIKQEEDVSTKEDELVTTKASELLVTEEKESTLKHAIEEKVEPVQVETKEAIVEPVIEEKERVAEPTIEEKECIAEPVIKKKESPAAPAIEDKECIAEPVEEKQSADEGNRSIVEDKVVLEEAPKAETDASPVITDEVKKEHIEPFLAAFNATEAITTLEAQHYISLLPKAPKPSKASEPFLASFNATEAVAIFEAQRYISSLPKAPKVSKAPEPFLAAFNTTEAITTLEAQHYISSLPKTPKAPKAPKASKAPEPFLAAYNASTALAALKAQEFIAVKFKFDETYVQALKSTLDRLQSQEKTNLSHSSLDDSLALSESTTNVSASHDHGVASHNEHFSALKAATETLLTEKSDEEDNNGLSLSPSDASSSTSTVHSSSMTEITRDIKTSNDITVDSNKDQGKALHVNTIDQNNNKPVSRFDWDQIYTGGGNDSKKSPIKAQQSPTSMQASPVTKTNEFFMTTALCTYYPNCTNKNCKFIHPGNENNPKPIPKRAATIDVEYKKPWTRPERIERQSQTHYPTWKSRCVHWPYCTNNHCKYSHPIKECRMGDQCTFMERCMFLHPADLIEPVRKGSRNNNNSNNTHVKRSNTTFN